QGGAETDTHSEAMPHARDVAARGRLQTQTERSNTMTVAIDLTRIAFEITWDVDLVGAPGDLVDIKATNPETGDVSTRDGLANDGRAVWRPPDDSRGDVEFGVTGPAGTDAGTVTL